jgi:hypothetical protein
MAKQTKTILRIKVNGLVHEIAYPSKAAAQRAYEDWAFRTGSQAKLTVQ